jgi:RES domain-containing protein
MKVYRIASCNYIQDLSGYGAFLNGGRWNSEGVYALYTASTASLAMLEILAHFQKMPKVGFCLMCLDIPDDSMLDIDVQRLPLDWNLYPAPQVLQGIGDKYLRDGKYLAIRLPSALLPEDKVILLNPKHPQFQFVKVDYSRAIEIDKRLYK